MSVHHCDSIDIVLFFLQLTISSIKKAPNSKTKDKTDKEPAT